MVNDHVEIREPDCPWCGRPPQLVLNPTQAFCGNDQCEGFCWDMTRTRAENEADVQVIDLTGSYLDPPQGEGVAGTR